MDIKPVEQQSISDDQELAKVLAGVSAQADDTGLGDSGLQLEETPLPGAPDPLPVAPVVEEVAIPTMPDPIAAVTPVVDDSLDGIKKDALNELRPLVDKLNVSPEEKYDTYLLLIRSTDDKTLIPSAFEAARAIADETRRAQALLDIIKEIDYLSGATTVQPQA